MKHRLPIDPDMWRNWLLGNLALLLYVIIQFSDRIPADLVLPPQGQLFIRIMLVVSWVLFLLCRPYYGEEEGRSREEYLAWIRAEKRARRQAKKREQIIKRAEKNSAQTQERAARAKRYADLRRMGYADPTYKGPRCPSCGSIEFEVIGRDHKAISLGGAVAGHILAGTPGMLLGAAMGEDGKYEAICLKCGKRFKFK